MERDVNQNIENDVSKLDFCQKKKTSTVMFALKY